MRIAYYGLSSPIFYDYKIVTETKNGGYSPNPILDGAIGSMLLFDEIWFFCEEVCPINMRQLPYVKFVVDMVDDKEVEKIKKGPVDRNETILKKHNESINSLVTQYRDLVRQIGVNWDSAIDRHTHDFVIKDTNYYGDSLSLSNIIFDLSVVDYLKISKKLNILLITNTFTQTWFENDEAIIANVKLSELITIDNIPNFLIKEGPYHSSIENLRENPYIQHFRKWMSEKKLKYDVKEINDLKIEIENELTRTQKEVFLRYFESPPICKNIGKTILGTVVDKFLIPGFSVAYDFYTEYSEYNAKKSNMWQAFIISSRKQF